MCLFFSPSVKASCNPGWWTNGNKEWWITLGRFSGAKLCHNSGIKCRSLEIGFLLELLEQQAAGTRHQPDALNSLRCGRFHFGNVLCNPDNKRIVWQIQISLFQLPYRKYLRTTVEKIIVWLSEWMLCSCLFVIFHNKEMEPAIKLPSCCSIFIFPPPSSLRLSYCHTGQDTGPNSGHFSHANISRSSRAEPEYNAHTCSPFAEHRYEWGCWEDGRGAAPCSGTSTWLLHCWKPPETILLMVLEMLSHGSRLVGGTNQAFASDFEQVTAAVHARCMQGACKVHGVHQFDARPVKQCPVQHKSHHQFLRSATSFS